MAGRWSVVGVPIRPVLLMLAGLLVSCSRPEAATPPLVLAAASLQGALDEAADRWAAAGHPRPVLSYAGTPAIARQIEAGAPADLFVSADAEWMEELAARGLIRADSRAVMATNALVLVAGPGITAPASNDLGAVLNGNERVAIADPDSVPAGRYAKASLNALGLWGAVEPRLIPTENVRAALALVERGAVPLGIVYATDARASARVRVVSRIPARTHPPIVYPLALMTASRNADAEPFLQFLLDREGQAILARHGFGPPPS